MTKEQLRCKRQTQELVRMSLKEFLPQKPTVFKVKAKKCNLFQPRVRYLERIVTADGYTMDPADVAAVLALKEARPSTFGALRKLLGITNYYRHNIKDFSRLAKPLNDILLCSDVPKATSTVNSRLADTSLLRTPRYYGQQQNPRRKLQTFD